MTEMQSLHRDIQASWIENIAFPFATGSLLSPRTYTQGSLFSCTPQLGLGASMINGLEHLAQYHVRQAWNTPLHVRPARMTSATSPVTHARLAAAMPSPPSPTNTYEASSNKGRPAIHCSILHDPGPRLHSGMCTVRGASAKMRFHRRRGLEARARTSCSSDEPSDSFSNTCNTGALGELPVGHIPTDETPSVRRHLRHTSNVVMIPAADSQRLNDDGLSPPNKMAWRWWRHSLQCQDPKGRVALQQPATADTHRVSPSQIASIGPHSRSWWELATSSTNCHRRRAEPASARHKGDT
jgi:hypothetical protein